VLKAPKLLFIAFDVALVLFDELLLLLLLLELPELFAFADSACVGVTFMCDDFVTPVELLVELLVVFVVLLDDDDDVEVEFALRFDEPDVVFELLRFDVADEV